MFAPPCESEGQHQPRQYMANELETNWQFHTTPTLGQGSQIRRAVALDCEMGVAESGESELIRVTVVDYFSCEVLVDKLVWPDVKMNHYNTRFSGVTRQAMHDARRTKSCLFGRNNARRAVCKFVGPDTIVVGHGVQQDLTSLRWIHPQLIDTLLVERGKRNREEKYQGVDVVDEESQQIERTKPAGGGLSLKALAMHRLNRLIQSKKKGHDNLEDSIATRDILHWNVVQALMLKTQSSESI